MPIVASKSETKPVIKQNYSSQFFPEIARQKQKKHLGTHDSARSKSF